MSDEAEPRHEFKFTRRRVTPTPWDIEYAAYQREVQKNIDLWESQQAKREMAEYLRDQERFGNQPRVPTVAGYDAAARRLGCEDAYEDNLRARYGEDF
jgi:hypothetical protein